MAKFEYRFPELGEGLHEGEIIKMHIKVGDKVTDDDIIMEVQNDKAVIEVPCPVNGTIQEVFGKDGAIFRVGDVVAVIDAEGEVPEQEAAPEQHGSQGSQEADAAKGGVDTKSSPASDSPVAAKQGGEDAAKGDSSSGSTTPAAPNKEVLATPSVRKFAREQGVELSQVTGSGKAGKITREDVESFKSGGGSSAAPEAQQQSSSSESTEVKSAPAASEGTVRVEEERVPFKGIRKAISNAMVKSAYTAPHVTIMDEVDVTDLVAFRTRIKPIAEKKGTKVTYLPFIVKALVAASREFPALNASIDEVNNEIVYKKHYDIGIATDTDNGLIVPVIKDADRKSIWMIADSIRDLATRGRDGKLSANEMRGSTISISNIGSAGGMFFTPIINYPEVAILGTGRISEKPVVKNGEIVVAPVMALSLSFDHRLIDGATAQNFMNYIKSLLGNPELLVMEV
ncbi:pyruvate dehydrogenase E2 component (dihydrolipoamide acetyltransferase) [Paenibacillus shirakamiensis]|uniref:Dihydrolipoamide acetyltransferase component of pyruvate dehydrogenase complex n=1 Tax=Paenibacillus shirakamiensis TaxID=1265935 RepID=A0ABS4JDL0_9BACL|nr:pyruvate dehydrogenase E2 component (dihydrolipoamide acetyltransferase) [Paenibacillus shirakamiensis]